MIFIKLGKRCREHCFMKCFYMLVTLFLISGCATVKEPNCEISKLEKIKLAIKSNTQAAIENIDLGMTRNEVISLIGNPRAKSILCYNFNYGNVWVIFDNDLVSAVVNAKYFNNCLSGTHYSSSHRVK